MEENLLKGKTLLVVDDEVDLRDIVASELEFMGAKVFQAENVQSAQSILSSETIDLVVSDIRMPGGTGIDLLDHVKEKDVNIPPVVLITGFADISLEDAFNKGAEALLNKPFRLDDLIRIVARYTAPFDERFNENLPPAVTKINPIPTTEIKLGRGGVAIELENQDKKYEVGQLVSFDFNFQNQRFIGEGICRWFRPSTQESRKCSMGLEFMKLAPESLSYLKALAEGQKLVPYIPSLDN